MSDTRIMIGFSANLLNPITKEQRDVILNMDSGLKVNYSCDIIYHVVQEMPSEEFECLFGEPEERGDFIDMCNEQGFDIDLETVNPFVVQWYDGVDCPMDTLVRLDV